MKQAYHSNASTNLHTRSLIKNSTQTIKSISKHYSISCSTVRKWKQREHYNDLSSRPYNIAYSLTDIESQLAVSVRKASWLSLDEVYEMLLVNNENVSRSSLYRLWCREEINRIPEKEKDKAKKFKEYEPGFLHIDVTYMPQFKGVKYYLFVAIDRATRAMYYKVYDGRTSENAANFISECTSFFPIVIQYVLTDNGLEFTNKILKSKKGRFCAKLSKFDKTCKKENIQHRLTKPASPQTNGMVERVNGTIKTNTILRKKYQDLKAMNEDLMNFLIEYNLFRRHGSLRKELNVKTPFQAMEKWHELKPELFKFNPNDFKIKILSLNQINSQVTL